MRWWLPQPVIRAVVVDGGICRSRGQYVTSVQRLGDSGTQAGSCRLIKVAMDASGNAVTAVKTASDTLKLITWRIQPSGVIHRLADSAAVAGITNGHDLAQAPGGRMATAVISEAGNLKIILWSADSSGGVTRWGDSGDLAGAASLPTLTNPGPTHRQLGQNSQLQSETHHLGHLTTTPARLLTSGLAGFLQENCAHFDETV